MVVQMTLAKTTVLLAFGGKTTSLPALVDWVADPVDTGVSADGLVGGAGETGMGMLVQLSVVLEERPSFFVFVLFWALFPPHSLDKDDLVVLVHTVLVDPVRVQDPQVTTPPTDTLFSGGPQTPLELEMVDTLPDGFTVGSTLWCWLLAVTTTNSNSVDEVTLLGLVSETTSLVWSGRSGSSVDDGELTVFPASDSGKELAQVGLLVAEDLSHVLVGTPVRGKREEVKERVGSQYVGLGLRYRSSLQVSARASVSQNHCGLRDEMHSFSYSIEKDTFDGHSNSTSRLLPR